MKLKRTGLAVSNHSCSLAVSCLKRTWHERFTRSPNWRAIVSDISFMKFNAISLAVVIRHWEFKFGVWYGIYLVTHLLVGVENAAF